MGLSFALTDENSINNNTTIAMTLNILLMDVTAFIFFPLESVLIKSD